MERHEVNGRGHLKTARAAVLRATEGEDEITEIKTRFHSKHELSRVPGASAAGDALLAAGLAKAAPKLLVPGASAAGDALLAAGEATAAPKRLVPGASPKRA